MKKKNLTEIYKLHSEMEDLVRDEFRGYSKRGIIVLTVQEMANVYINILKDFMDMQRSKQIA